MGSGFGGLKARDVEGHIRSMGFEKGTVHCVTKLAEYQTVIRESQFELAGAITQMTDIVTNFVAVADNMKMTIEQLRSKDSEVDDEQVGD